jgi:hypothetical protein
VRTPSKEAGRPESKRSAVSHPPIARQTYPPGDCRCQRSADFARSMHGIHGRFVIDPLDLKHATDIPLVRAAVGAATDGASALAGRKDSPV